MKKYKLIKEFPNSAKLNTVAIQNKNFPDTYDLVGYGTIHSVFIKDYPEFWQEVVEKNWEILSFELKKGVFTDTKQRILTRTSTGAFEGYYTNHTEDYLLKDGNANIKSIKRLSDGEVFTIGDRVKYSDNSGTIKLIKKFYITNYLNQMMITCSDSEYSSYSIGLMMKAKQPLFKTEDGVDIFKDDYYCIVHGDITISKELKALKESAWYTGMMRVSPGKYFSTKKAAEEYILMNKPCLSINDFRSIKAGGMNLFLKVRYKDLEQLAKSKQNK